MTHIKDKYSQAHRLQPLVHELTTLQSRYEIDHKNDQFIESTFVSITEDPMRKVQSSVASYTLWMEEEHIRGHASRLQDHERQSWYSRRRGMLSLATNTLDIPVMELAKMMKNLSDMAMLSDRAMNVEECVRHFLDWEMK